MASLSVETIGLLCLLIVVAVASLFLIAAAAAAAGVYISKQVVATIVGIDREPKPAVVPVPDRATTMEDKPPFYCGHCGCGMRNDPELELAMEDASYLRFRCPACTKITLVPTPAAE